VEVDVDVGGPSSGDLVGVTWDLWLDRISLGGEGPAALDDFAEAIDTSSLPDAPSTSPSITVPSAEADPPDGSVRATSARAESLIQAFDASKGPALYYLHLILPHQPWHLYPDGTSYDMLDGEELALPVADLRRLFSWSPWTSAVSEQRHLLQAEYTDRIVGQVMQGLRAAGLYDDSLVIVTADHGVSFESDTSGRYVEPSTIDAIAYAPLLVKEPGQHDGVVDDGNVTIVDVLPTIADRLDLTIPWTVDGDPAGSAAIAARGVDKEIYDMIGLGGLQIRRILEFDDRATFATVGDRWIGPLSEPGHPLSALDELLGLDRLTGRRLDDVVTTRGGSVQLDRLDALRHPPDGDVRIGVVTGIVSGAPSGAKLVLAIDGVVVGGSELSTDSSGRAGRIAVLLPPGALDEENDVRAALVVDGEVRALEVEG
jgi:Sulfatase